MCIYTHSRTTGVGADGSYLVSNFAKGGEGERASYKKFIKCVHCFPLSLPP